MQGGARLLSGGVLPAAVFDKLLQFAIPALRAFVIHDQRAEHAHALHQRGEAKFPSPAGCGSIFPSRHSDPCRGGVLRLRTSSSETLEWSPPLV